MNDSFITYILFSLSMKTFQSLGLKKHVLSAIELHGLKSPTEIQEKVIPSVKAGNNAVFISPTGSGKTLAYTIGFLDRINTKQSLQMIVVVPTRELCIQVGKEIKDICEELAIQVGFVYGGKDMRGDHKIVSKKNHILVGTPGRLEHHINEKNIKVGDVKYIVFDESDQMFDNGFIDTCIYFLNRISREAQISLASATITEKVEYFIDKIIKGYDLIKVGVTVPKNIIQEKHFVPIPEKNKYLLKFFKENNYKKTMIFCNTKIKVAGITKFLKDNGFSVESLSSEFDQKDRENHLRRFKDGKTEILVTTDVAARGLHMIKVDCIINYDVPTRDEFYIHRIGRTGRTKENGYALTLICPEDDDRFANIEFEYELNVKEV
jgi:ATP-dependent RNA helicase DeaD